MKKSTIVVIILYVILSLCAVKINAQDPKAVILQPKKQVIELKLNSQGFNIPANCPDTTRVYQIGEKGSKFIFRTSKKTGKTYRFYLTEKK